MKNEITRNKKEKIHAIVETFSFDQALEKSDMVAKVKIIDTVKEIHEPSAKTIFNAEVIKEYKNDSFTGETINVMQEGNSKVEFNGTSLFKPGDEYILMLMKASNFEIENTYWILGAETGIYEILDNDTVIKWAKADGQLKSIEHEAGSEKLSIYLNKKSMDEANKEFQVLNKEKFEQFIQSMLTKSEASS